MKKIAIIPARGGSKRLPRKNMIQFLGKPMLTYPIETAIRSELFDQVIVSTEDDEIAVIAKGAGARVMKRPEELAQDRRSVKEVCLQVLDELNREGLQPDFFCCIYATAVFLTMQDLIDSYSLISVVPASDVVMGVSEFNLQPVQALVEVDGFLKPQWPEYEGVQSQFQPRLVASNGTLYWTRVCTFRQTKSFYGGKVRGYEMPWIKAIDIDTPADLEIATLIGPLLKSKYSID